MVAGLVVSSAGAKVALCGRVVDPAKGARRSSMPCLLFENQGAENSGYVTKEFLTDLARQTEGLDVNEWNEAREDSFEKELRAAQQRAEEDGVNSTPSLVVCGPDGQVTLRGAVPIEDVDAAIQEAGGYWAFARAIRGVSAPGSPGSRWVGS